MTTKPGGIHNPTPTFPFCPDQTDFLTFRSDYGFSAVYLELIEGFVANDAGGTNVALANNSIYSAQESVPELVSRYAEVKRRRYEKERPQALTPCAITKVITPTETATERTAAAIPVPVTDATFEGKPESKPDLPAPRKQSIWTVTPPKS